MLVYEATLKVHKPSCLKSLYNPQSVQFGPYPVFRQTSSVSTLEGDSNQENNQSMRVVGTAFVSHLDQT